MIDIHLQILKSLLFLLQWDEVSLCSDWCLGKVEGASFCQLAIKIRFAGFFSCFQVRKWGTRMFPACNSNSIHVSHQQKSVSNHHIRLSPRCHYYKQFQLTGGLMWSSPLISSVVMFRCLGWSFASRHGSSAFSFIGANSFVFVINTLFQSINPIRPDSDGKKSRQYSWELLDNTIGICLSFLVQMPTISKQPFNFNQVAIDMFFTFHEFQPSIWLCHFGWNWLEDRVLVPSNHTWYPPMLFGPEKVEESTDLQGGL